MSTKWDYQGKTKQQVEFSTMMCGVAMFAIIVMMVIGYIIGLIC